MLDIITAYLFDLEAAGRSPLTIMSYRQHLTHLAQFLGGRRIRRVSTEDLRAYLVSLSNLKPSTIRARFTIISCFFRWCVEEGVIHESPMTHVRQPKKPCQRREVFSTGELLSLFEASERTRNPTRNKAMLCLLLDCGLRAAELLSLKLESYNPASSTLTIQGKGQKVRVVRMGARCREAFEAHLRGVDGHLWDITGGGFRDMIRQVGEKAGVHANPHKFRHSFSVRFLDAGGGLDSLQVLLGHSDIGTTMIYTQMGQEARALRSLARYSPVDNLPIAS
ncbi:MAG TPA: tyrosine-type recombinase/integrase [Anaerolineae bacterium]|nr:tyrosine-type recombinase/integrase [Anaerolineae bacterium]